MKRFTETTKWSDPWFMDLPVKYKSFWFYVCDQCDCAGIWEPNIRLAIAQIGEPLELVEILRVFSGRIEQIGDGKLLIKKFIEFQYGILSPDCKPHIPVLKRLAQLGIRSDDIPQSKTLGKNSDVSAKTRAFVIHRDGAACAYCEKTCTNFELVLDHVVPRAKGGHGVSGNLVVSCAKCNTDKGDSVLSLFSQRFENPERLLQRVSERVSITLMEKEMEKEMESLETDCGSDWSSAVKLLSKTALKRFEEWMAVRKSMGKKPKNWEKMFSEQIKWLSEYPETVQIEIISASIRNNWQGLFEPKNRTTTQPRISPEHRQNRINFLNEKKKKTMRLIKDPVNPPSWAEKELAGIDAELKQL